MAAPKVLLFSNEPTYDIYQTSLGGYGGGAQQGYGGAQGGYGASGGAGNSFCLIAILTSFLYAMGD